MNDVLFLIVTLLLLSLITGLRMLVHIWGKKYRYNSTWELLETDVASKKGRSRKVNRYGR